MFSRFDRIHERDGRTDRQTAWQYRPRLHSIARQKRLCATDQQPVDGWHWSNRCTHGTHAFTERVLSAVRADYCPTSSVVDHIFRHTLRARRCLQPHQQTDTFLRRLYWNIFTFNVTNVILLYSTTHPICCTGVCYSKIWAYCKEDVVYMCQKWYDYMQPGWCQPVRQEFMENECEALPGVAYPGVRDNRNTLNTKTRYDDDDCRSDATDK